MLIGVLIAVVTGVFIAAMGPVNAVLTGRVGSWSAVTLVHLIGLLVATAGLLFFDSRGKALPGGADLRYLLWPGVIVLAGVFVWVLRSGYVSGVPAFGFFGGALGVLVVIGTVGAIGRLGVLGALTVIVSSQLLAASLIDQFGWFGQHAIPLNPLRVLGLALMLAGVVLVLRS
ncbi:DMT family transporter [Oceanithermus sp.]